MKSPSNLGILLLAIYLIAIGVIALLGLTFRYQAEVMAILAIATGVLLLLRK
jgi:hypothetical protein